MASLNCQVAVYCLLCFAAVLAAPPKYVYRADFRPPEKIFSNGFQALGNNANLDDHVTGVSCSSSYHNSAFVATTSSKEFAVAWGRDRTAVNCKSLGEYVYVYTIRATDNFYDAHESLLEAYHNTGDSNYQVLAERFRSQHEWLAYNGIPNNQVKDVDMYKRPGGSENMIFLHSQHNQFYVDAQSHGNPHPFQISGRATISNWILRTKYVSTSYSTLAMIVAID